jgi:hypothetical protein
MDDSLKKYTQVDRLVGQEISDDILNSLITEGRVQFTPKDTTTSAISQPGDVNDDDLNTDGGEDIDDMIGKVKDNEDMVKLLEDMRDDMLKDMKIPPASDDIADAAKKLGSLDGTITKDILDKAQTILDPVIMEPNLQGYSSIMAALTGNGNIDGDFLQCNEVTKGMMDDWNARADDEGDLTADELHKQGAGDSVTRARESFSKKMADMFKYIFNMLWWEMIWPRMVLFFLETTERFIAIPIDTPFLILRFFKKLTKKNYMTYGPIHKLLNKLKILLLCTVPTNAWNNYNPDPEIKVWDTKNSEFVPLNEWCSKNDAVEECTGDIPEPATFGTVDDKEDDTWDSDADQMQKGLRNKLDALFPGGSDTCMPSRFNELFSADSFEGPGMSPECAEAAKKIMEAVYDDALHFGEYEGSQAQAEQGLDFILNNNIKGAKKEAG